MNFKERMYRFMYGRYGADALNTFLMFFILIIAICNALLMHNAFINLCLWVLLYLYIWRTYSKNILKRRKENEVFLRYIRPLRRYILLYKRRMQDKSHKYYLCPKCHQTVRVPKGRGKITITCPTCKNRFNKRS